MDERDYQAMNKQPKSESRMYSEAEVIDFGIWLGEKYWFNLSTYKWECRNEEGLYEVLDSKQLMELYRQSIQPKTEALKEGFKPCPNHPDVLTSQCGICNGDFPKLEQPKTEEGTYCDRTIEGLSPCNVQCENCRKFEFEEQPDTVEVKKVLNQFYDKTTCQVVNGYHIEESGAVHNKSNTLCIGCIGADLIPVKSLVDAYYCQVNETKYLTSQSVEKMAEDEFKQLHTWCLNNGTYLDADEKTIIFFEEQLFAKMNEIRKQTVGALLEGEHPDEIYPRAASWLAERRNWAAQVKMLEQQIEGYKSNNHLDIAIAHYIKLSEEGSNQAYVVAKYLKTLKP